MTIPKGTRLYFWDWHNSGKIESTMVSVIPFHSNEYMESQDCFTCLKKAKKRAREDVYRRRQELDAIDDGIKNADVLSVPYLDYMKGI
jgi:hypothetical protein